MEMTILFKPVDRCREENYDCLFLRSRRTLRKVTSSVNMKKKVPTPTCFRQTLGDPERPYFLSYLSLEFLAMLQV